MVVWEEGGQATSQLMHGCCGYDSRTGWKATPSASTGPSVIAALVSKLGTIAHSWALELCSRASPREIFSKVPAREAGGLSATATS